MPLRPAFLRAAVSFAVLSLAFPFWCSAKRKFKPFNQAAFNKAVAKAQALYSHKNFQGAIAAFRKADDISHHHCPGCHLQIYAIDEQISDPNGAMDETQRAIKECGPADKTAAAEAHLCRANLLSQLAGNKPSDTMLARAVVETRLALTLDPAQPIAHYNLGLLLLRQEHDAAGIAELRAYLASPKPNASTARQAATYIAHPNYAREPLAPDFSFTTLDGSQISLAALKGKVTVLDFWASWCPPCRESVPTLAYLHKKFAGQPVDFVGISSDRDQEAWKKFVAAHHMDWPEYLDLSDSMFDAYQVEFIPTYIVIDARGLIRFRQSDFNDQTTGLALETAIKKALMEGPQEKKPS